MVQISSDSQQFYEKTWKPNRTDHGEDRKFSITSLVDDVEGAVDDVVELEGVVGLGEALYVKRVVLSKTTLIMRFMIYDWVYEYK